MAHVWSFVVNPHRQAGDFWGVCVGHQHNLWAQHPKLLQSLAYLFPSRLRPAIPSQPDTKNSVLLRVVVVRTQSIVQDVPNAEGESNQQNHSNREGNDLLPGLVQQHADTPFHLVRPEKEKLCQHDRHAF
jgi:hypothetical protein